MRRPHIVCVTCRELPEPDPDEPLLRAAIERAGGDYTLAAWDDPTVDWASADLVVPRSTWDYYEAPDAFLAWAERVDAATRLLNPLAVIRANVHKRYLLALERAGVPIVPTELVGRGEARALASIVEARGWSDVVIKPAIGARSWGNRRVRPGEEVGGEAHLAAMLAERDALVQPYLQAVEDHGERSLIWIDGEMTHSIRKEPRFGDADESVSEEAVPPPPGGRAIVDAALRAVGAELLYARVDVVPDPTGQLVVMELELVEPSLFFAQDPAALERFCRAAVRRAIA
ncbi:MAG: hypothetical protein H6719_08205 [Sandaracinaceae bacterium]|nr:hypothetical protein [Sandaracinaceae bacterium]